MLLKGQDDGIYKESAVVDGHALNVVKEIDNAQTEHRRYERRVTSKISIL